MINPPSGVLIKVATRYRKTKEEGEVLWHVQGVEVKISHIRENRREVLELERIKW